MNAPITRSVSIPHLSQENVPTSPLPGWDPPLTSLLLLASDREPAAVFPANGSGPPDSLHVYRSKWRAGIRLSRRTNQACVTCYKPVATTACHLH